MLIAISITAALFTGAIVLTAGLLVVWRANRTAVAHPPLEAPTQPGGWDSGYPSALSNDELRARIKDMRKTIAADHERVTRARRRRTELLMNAKHDKNCDHPSCNAYRNRINGGI